MRRNTTSGGRRHYTRKISTAVKLRFLYCAVTDSRFKTRRKLDTIDLTEEVDESLIGGFVLRHSDKVIDSSVAQIQRAENDCRR
ncbi:MAG: F0F1 ATP synthase subunit delta [Bacteroidetes bacterium]|nr:F0F1 ATP synthase subunit delta [Bacteroidota bacterium]